MNVTIREYTISDQSTLANMFYDFTAYMRNIDPMQRIPTIEGYGEKWMEIMLDKVAKNNGKIFVAEYDNKIVGFVIGTIKHQTDEEKLEAIPTITGDLLELYVEKAHRGKNIGTMLLNKIEAYFKQNNCDVGWLGVFAPNISAIEFYKKNDYQERVVFLIKKLKKPEQDS